MDQAVRQERGRTPDVAHDYSTNAFYRADQYRFDDLLKVLQQKIRDKGLWAARLKPEMVGQGQAKRRFINDSGGDPHAADGRAAHAALVVRT